MLCPSLNLTEDDYCYFSKSMPTKGIPSQKSLINNLGGNDLVRALK